MIDWLAGLPKTWRAAVVLGIPGVLAVLLTLALIGVLNFTLRRLEASQSAIQRGQVGLEGRLDRQSGQLEDVKRLVAEQNREIRDQTPLLRQICRQGAQDAVERRACDQ